MMKISNGSGPHVGALSLLTDATRLGQAVDAGGAGAWEWRIPEGVIHINQRLASLLGLMPPTLELAAGRLLGLVHEEDAALLRVAIGEAMRGEREFAHEFRFHREDTGELRWLCVQGRIVERAAQGEVTLAGLSFDITERRFAQETRELLNRELSHRLKNLLSIVGSLVVMTGEQQPEARDFVTSFQARLNNLAAAHDLLVQANWEPVALSRLVEKALAPIGVLDRIEVQANGLVLSSYDAQTVVLVVYELATNAIKYGALSNAKGRVTLDFEMRHAISDGDSATLVMRWQEKDGPEVTPPVSKGFGVSLLERLARRQRPGEPVLDWKPQGLCCNITLRINPPWHKRTPSPKDAQ